MEEFLEDQEAADGKLQFEHEFLKIPENADDEQEWARIHMEILHPRKLVVASGVMHLCAQNSCPPQLRIRQIPPEEMKELLAKKVSGNEEFAKQNYIEAIEFYNEALDFLEHFYVAPAEQVEQVVNVLSNKAECHLRLKQYEDAADVATAALLLDNSHDKSRLRRAKAEMAIAGASYLIQARVDLKEIVEQHHSIAGVRQAKEFLSELEEILAMEKRTFESQHPEGDWDQYVRMLEATCW